MQRTRRIMLALTLIAGLGMLSTSAVAGGAANTSAESPEAVVANLYRDHFDHQQNWEATFKRQRDRFSPDLLLLLDDDMQAAAANPEQVEGLDFDPLTNSQEAATSYEVTGTRRDGKDAVVAVTLLLGREQMKLGVRMVAAGSVWHVANITYPAGDLVKVLAAQKAGRKPK